MPGKRARMLRDTNQWSRACRNGAGGTKVTQISLIGLTPFSKKTAL